MSKLATYRLIISGSILGWSAFSWLTTDPSSGCVAPRGAGVVIKCLLERAQVAALLSNVLAAVIVLAWVASVIQRHHERSKILNPKAHEKDTLDLLREMFTGKPS